MSKTVTIVGPQDHGRRMTLDEFEFAEGAEGRLYELSRGVVTLIDVPKRKHLRQIEAIRDQLYPYKAANPNRIYTIATGAECKILLEDLQSERHPDLAVYLNPPPDEEEDDEVWSTWIPELVIEVGYDHAAAGRIRHGARFRRFRTDKDPRECVFSALDEG